MSHICAFFVFNLRLSMWQKIPAFWSNQGFADDMPFLVVKIIPG
jgi:hypothetical protein